MKERKRLLKRKKENNFLYSCLTHLLNSRESRGQRRSKNKQQVKEERGYSPAEWDILARWSWLSEASESCHLGEEPVCSSSSWMWLPLGFVPRSGWFSHKGLLSGYFASPCLGPLHLAELRPEVQRTLTGRESSQDLSGTEVCYVTSSCAGS